MRIISTWYFAGTYDYLADGYAPPPKPTSYEAERIRSERRARTPNRRSPESIAIVEAAERHLRAKLIRDRGF